MGTMERGVGLNSVLVLVLELDLADFCVVRGSIDPRLDGAKKSTRGAAGSGGLAGETCRGGGVVDSRAEWTVKSGCRIR